MIDRQTVDRILDAANIVDVVSDFVTLRRAGANLKGLCPFHDDRTPSFMVSPSKNICKCFACGKGGTPVHFIMEHEQLSYPDALRYLAKKYHIEVKEREQTDEEKAEQSERESLFVVNEWANEWFQTQMNDTVDGRAIGLAYFRQRGFRDDVIKKFQLGFCPDKYDALWQAAKAEGFNEEYVLKTGLCIRNEQGKTYDRFRNRVIFPIHSISGKVVGFGGRVLDSRTKGVNIKYQNSPESVVYSKKRELYGLFQAKQAIVKEELCYLVEGYTDVMAMHQMGVENVVASSGTALTSEQIRAIHRFTENIVVIYDGDEAGIKASQRGIDMLLAEGMSVKLLMLPDGDDPDSFARKHTALEYQQYLAEHQVDFIRFKTDLLLAEAQGDPIKLSRLVNNIVDSIAVIPDEITRTFYIKETSQMLAVEERIIISAVDRVRRRQREDRQKEREREARIQEQTTDKPQQPSTPAEQPESEKALTPEEEAAIAGTQQQAADGQVSLQRTGTTINITNARRDSEQTILQAEALIIQMIVRYGQRVMCEVENDEGQMQPLTVVEFVDYSLAEDNLVLRDSRHRQILTEALEHFADEGFRADRYFENHPDIKIAELANELAHDPETLSRIHERGMPVKPEEERLQELLPHIMGDYKLAIVDNELQSLMKELSSPSVLTSKEQTANLLKRYQELKQIQGKLGRVRGDRVIT